MCYNQLKDMQLAITIARVYEGDQGPVLKRFLEEEVLAVAAQEGNRWLASWAFWMLHRRDMSVRALIVSSLVPSVFYASFPFPLLVLTVADTCLHPDRNALLARPQVQAFPHRRPGARHPLRSTAAEDFADPAWRIQGHAEGGVGARPPQCPALWPYGL